jgi:hypothetical protein
LIEHSVVTELLDEPWPEIQDFERSSILVTDDLPEIEIAMTKIGLVSAHQGI